MAIFNAAHARRRQLVQSLLTDAENGTTIELADLTDATSHLLRLYNNQLCEPDASWITSEELESLPKLLRLLATGVEQLEGIDTK